MRAVVAQQRWTEILHVFAVVTVEGIVCIVQKCDTKRAVLQVETLCDAAETWWTELIHVGGVYAIGDRYFEVEAMNAPRLLITLAPSGTPDEVARTRLARWQLPLSLDDQADPTAADSDEWTLPAAADRDDNDAWRDLGYGGK